MGRPDTLSAVVGAAQRSGCQTRYKDHSGPGVQPGPECVCVLDNSRFAGYTLRPLVTYKAIIGEEKVNHSQLFYNALAKLWPLSRVVYWLGNRPLVGPLLRPLFDAPNNEVIILPVQETVRTPESVVLPYPLLTSLVEQASAHFVMQECLCRRGENCQTYPHDVGCLFLGDGAAEITLAIGRLVSADEAMAHVRRAMALGLTPLIVHTVFDAWVLGIPYRRMLGICFCCDCCCIVRQGLRLGPQAFWDIVVRLPGLAVEVGPECTGCGTCLDACYVQAIVIEDGRACISDEQCKGCGRCVAICPAGAITLRMAGDVDVLGRLLARIERRTDIGPAT